MRPNILFILPDQWRADWTAMNTGLPIRTPNLVRLANHGAWFTTAITPSPLCAPARAALASGLEYDRCGVPDNTHDYPLNQSTFYALLREAGYHVMGCGKFDLAKADFGWKIDGSSRLAEWGFDEGIDSEGKWDGIASGQVEPRGPYIAYLEERGLRLTHVEDMLRRQSSRLAAFPTPLPDDAYCDNWIAGIGLRLIASAPRHKPWFLQVNFAGPHDPWDITAAMAEMYRGINFPLPPGLNPGQAEAHLAVRQNYAAMIENIDRWLGVFLNTLQENGQFSETLVVVSSDHGEMLGDRGCWGKTVPCQGSLAVPLAISGPGVSQAAVVRSPTTILDLLLRPGFQALVKDAQSGAFDIVVAEALDRLSRDQEHVAALLKQMRFAGIVIRTVAEGEIGELHVGLKGTMNALFLKDLAQKTHRGLSGRIAAGKSAGGRCYGYDVVRRRDEQGEPIRGERAINPAEAPIVRRIFAMFAAGASPIAIAKQLNAEGIPARQAMPGATPRSAATRSAAPASCATRSTSGGWCGTG